MNSESPLTYKCKIQSEISEDVTATVSEDEKFLEWDHLLRKYSQLLNDIINQLSN